MKLCRTCGKKYPDSATYCTKDLTQLTWTQSPDRPQSSNLVLPGRWRIGPETHKEASFESPDAYRNCKSFSGPIHVCNPYPDARSGWWVYNSDMFASVGLLKIDEHGVSLRVRAIFVRFLLALFTIGLVFEATSIFKSGDRSFPAMTIAFTLLAIAGGVEWLCYRKTPRWYFHLSRIVNAKAVYFPAREYWGIQLMVLPNPDAFNGTGATIPIQTCTIVTMVLERRALAEAVVAQLPKVTLQPIEQ